MRWYMKLFWTLMVLSVVVLVYFCNVVIWQTLEIYIDGDIHTSNADTIVNIVLTYFMTKEYVKRCFKLIYRRKSNERRFK
jgi:hypothetical protein